MDHQIKIDAVDLDVALVGSQISGDNFFVYNMGGVDTCSRYVLRAAIKNVADIIADAETVS